ncbi:MAG: biotin carboxylase N-terminal domain-containing protein [Chloroflexota bacterium]
MPFQKLLIANRGEIAVRVARACAELGIKSVAVYSEADRDALQVRVCDEAYFIGRSPATESYLRGDVIIEVARRAGCDAIHPGFGFLSENAGFARAVVEAGLTWVGPTPEAITLMGSKIEAKRIAERAGVPIVPGYFGDDQSPGKLHTEAERIGFPVLIKASAGGGGKGMRVVEHIAHLEEGVDAARREALAAFGDGSIMIEKYLSEPRHIEVQVLGDNYGKIIHLGERECSIQRRHQKVLEESPSPAVSALLRERLTRAALSLARAAGYTNAGTVEFILQDGEFYFLEMNTRLQVEHTVTEEALDIDMVAAQLRIASGEHLWLEQEDIEFVGHAVEVRLYAEDPERGFLPSTGKITQLNAPHEEEGVRIDPGVSLGDTITAFYDPMIAKLITSGESRNDALRRMREVLGGLEIAGVTTNLDFLRWLVGHPQFELGNLSTRFIEKYYRPGAFPLAPIPVLLGGAAVQLLSNDPDARDSAYPWAGNAWRVANQGLQASLVVEGHTYDAALSSIPGAPSCWAVTINQAGSQLLDAVVRLVVRPQTEESQVFDGSPSIVQVELPDEPLYSMEYGWGEDGSPFIVWEKREYWVRLTLPLSTERMNTSLQLRGENSLESPMPGKVLKLLVADGADVIAEQPLVIIEAMKMEFTVRAPHDGRVASVKYREGDQVAVGDVLVELEKE